jgi:hypothetical protein
MGARDRTGTSGCQLSLAPGCSGRWNPHADVRAIVPEQGEGDRRAAGVIDVPDSGPRVTRHPDVGDVVGDVPEPWDIRAAVMMGNDGQQLLARLGLGERDRGRWSGALVRRGGWGGCTAHGQCRGHGRRQQHPHRYTVLIA